MTNLPAPQREVNELSSLIADMAHEKIDQSLSVSKQEAQATHYQFITAAEIGKKASYIVRNKAAEMYLTQGWMELELPYPDDPKEKISFEDYGAWIGFAVEQAGLSDTTASTLKSFILNIIDPVAKRLVLNPDNGQPYTVDEVLDLREFHTQKLASAARRVLHNPDTTEDEKYGLLSAVVDLARKTSRDNFINDLRDMELSTRRTPSLEGSFAYNNDRVVFMMEFPEEFMPIVNAWLENRVNFRTKTVEDLMDELMQMQLTKQVVEAAVEPPDNSNWSLEEPSKETEVDPQEVNDWLNGQ